MSEEIKGVSSATDEDVHGIRQSILKGYVQIESLLARIQQDAELLREAEVMIQRLVPVCIYADYKAEARTVLAKLQRGKV